MSPRVFSEGRIFWGWICLEKKHQLGIFLVLAFLASASTWFYANRILKAKQVADAAVLGIPRGNLSDLYPRWLGARELLRHGRNPYSPEITREIQIGYYGRPLDPARPNDPKDQQAFAYPVYVVFLLAPSVDLPFDQVRTGFRWLLFALAPLSMWLWLQVLRWKPRLGEAVIYAVLLLGWLPMMQGIKLQQLSLIVAALMAGCAACLTMGWSLCAGGFLALATIKPQLAWPMALWLLFWTVSDWRERRRFVFGFALVMLLLLGGAELILPGWIAMFVHGLGQYHQYTQNQSVLVWMFGSVIGRVLEAGSVIACAASVWLVRRDAPRAAEFGRATALVLALTVVVVPMFAPYNQVLLVPAILALVRSMTSKTSILPVVKLACMVGALLLVWPWIATLGLTVAHFWLAPERRNLLWQVWSLYLPLYSNFVVPILVFLLALVDGWLNPARGLRDAAPAE
jgi:Glycosyltransferase family 87